MPRLPRFALVLLCSSLLLAMSPLTVAAQRRGARPHPTHPPRTAVVRGHVFIGGYFYDPFFGPYPWWGRPAYPYWYFPVYDSQANLRMKVTPEAADRAAVYVDGFYAGIVDDFDGLFEALPLPPGGHSVVLYLQGYRTARHNIYLSRGSTFTLRETLERLPAGAESERPELAAPVPPPPPGTYRLPGTSPTVTAPPVADAPQQAVGFGAVDLFVQPASAIVTIDGQRWITTEEGHFVVQVPAGRHRIEITKPGYRRFASDIEVRDGETKSLNVSLLSATT